MATLRCGIYNVRVNLVDVVDSSDRKKIEATIATLLSHGTTMIKRVAPAIWERNRGGK
jgi:formiminotetrahydrofolate cyclodeaminase